MTLFLTMILPEISCSGLKRLQFLRKVCHWQLIRMLWRMALFPDSHLQDMFLSIEMKHTYKTSRIKYIDKRTSRKGRVYFETR